MASPDRPSSNLPPSMGPGARPVQAGEAADAGGKRTLLSEQVKIRSKYNVAVEPEVLQLGYELNGIPRMYRLPFESMPLGSFSRWALYGGPLRAKVSGFGVLELLRRVEEINHEPATQREAEAFAYHLSKSSISRLTGNVLAFSLGGFIAYRTRENMKFPFLSPKPLERYDNFPNRYLPLVQGRYARYLWHATRANMWVALIWMGTTPIFSSLGTIAAGRGTYSDERLQNVMRTMTRSLSAADGRPRSAHTVQQETRRPAQSETPYSGSAQQPYYGTRDTGAPYYDSTARQDEGGRAYPEESTDTELVSDSGWQSQGSGRTPSMSDDLAYQKSSASTQRTQPGRDDRYFESDSFFDDDASPTAGNGPDMSSSAPYGRSTGNAWARLRSGNNPNGSQQGGPPGHESERQWEATEGSGSRELWGSRETPEQTPGQTTQKMSQKEFDEMLERERRLSGSDEYSTGMRAVESGQDKATESGSGSSAWDRRRNW